MNYLDSRKLYIDKDLHLFKSYIDINIREAMDLFGSSKGMPLLILNNNDEFVGTLSNGDIRRYLHDKNNSIYDCINNVINKEAKFCFEFDDKSIYEYVLSQDTIKIVPILDSNKKLVSVAYYDDIYFKIKNKILNRECSEIYLIAEIGVNHNGDVNEAKKLVDAISEAGFDAVKMQFRSSITYSNIREKNDTDLSTEYILSELDRVELSFEEEGDIIKYIKNKNLDFIGTPFDNEALNRLLKYKPDALKIASCDLTNHILIRSCAEKNLPMILSTGMSTETEIIRTNELLEELNVNRSFLHCNSTYPTPIRDVNLSYISRLSDITESIIGYSSHDGNPLIPLASITSGAKIVELHVTSDKNALGTDHIASLEINKISEFVSSARNLSLAMGSSRPRIPSQGELMNKIPLGKSLCFGKNMKSGERLNVFNDIIACSPGDGIPISKFKLFHNLTLNQDVKKLDKLNKKFFKEYQDRLVPKNGKNILSEFAIDKLSKYRWGIPVRYRDINELNNLFKPPIFEIHLSSRDLDQDFQNLEKSELLNKQIIVHAIEQYHDGFILDLASSKKEINEKSLKRINNFFDHCNKIYKYLKPNSKIKVVLNCGGFSKYGFLDEDQKNIRKNFLYENLNFIKNKYIDFEILPQTMPPFPWHQGGTAYHNLIRSSNDIEDLYLKTKLNVCFDFSHSFMESVYSDFCFNELVTKSLNNINHLHLSDSSSSSNEGLNIDDGNIDFEFTLKEIFKNDNKASITFIPEVWQGHLNQGQGFKISLERIARYLAKID